MSLPFDPVGAAISVVGLLYENAIKPRIDGLKVERDRKEALESAIQEYLRHYYSKLMMIRTIVYSEHVKLYDIYHPLRLNSNKDGREYEINSNCHFILNENDRIVLIDFAGMGKSTVSKFIFLRLCDNHEYIPIFLELRRIKRDKGIIDLLREDLGRVGAPAPAQVVQDLLSLSNLLIIFDGFDETQLDLKDGAIREISDIVHRYPGVRYLITSRKDGLVDLAPSFTLFSIDRLHSTDVESILRIYDPNDIKASKILSEINNIEDRSFHHLLENPMMVTLLFRSYSYNGEIPTKTFLFYDQVYKSLFNGHDLLKGYKREHLCNLDIHQLQNLLSHIAINSIKNGPSYEPSVLLSLIENALRIYNYTSTRPQDVLSDLYQAIPLLSDEGSEIRWVHKSFQDYFSAYYVAFIANEQAKQILTGIYKSSRSFQYSNMIEMLLDMKPILVEEVLFLPMADDYIDFVARCREYGLDKFEADNLFKRAGIIQSNYLDALDKAGVAKKDFQGLVKFHEGKVSTLIPDGKILYKYQSMSRYLYYASAESANYWIFELLLSSYNLAKLVENDIEPQSEVVTDVLYFGHNNILDINENTTDVVRAVMSSPRRGIRSETEVQEGVRTLIDVDEASLTEYIYGLRERIRSTETTVEF